MKIFSVVGARPQFIKLAPLSRALRTQHEEIIVHTGQHYDDNMSRNIFRDLDLQLPDYNLGVGSESHSVQTGRILIELEKVFKSGIPDLVIVFGDTNTTLAGALAAAKLKIPILHIEAGLRSFNRQMPEEINRIVADHVSDYLFAPTINAVKNLETDGLRSGAYLTGDIMVDTLQMSLPVALQKSEILNKLDLRPDQYYLLTLHRPYNVDKKNVLSHILNVLSQSEIPIVFPVHPRTQGILSGLDADRENFIFTEPLGYYDFIVLENHSKKILTDSGGVQKEAYILKKPCITLRTETEWTETVEDGWNLLIDPSEDNYWNKIRDFTPIEQQQNVFGNKVAERMVECINNFN